MTDWYFNETLKALEADTEKVTQHAYDHVVSKYCFDHNLPGLIKVLACEGYTQDYLTMLETCIRGTQFFHCSGRPDSDQVPTSLYLLERLYGPTYTDQHLDCVIGICKKDIYHFRSGQPLIVALIQKGCKTQDPRLLADYASLGNLSMVKWLVEQGIDPINEDAIIQAHLGYNQQALVDYLLEKSNNKEVLTSPKISELRSRYEERSEAEAQAYMDYMNMGY